MKIKKEKYDYHYDRNGVPIITVCYILTENGIVGRGVSVLSKQDEYYKEAGDMLAQTHAIRAIKGRRIDNFSRKEVIASLIRCKCPFIKKGERNPRLSWWERQFLFGTKKMHKYNACGYFELMSAGERGSAIGTKLRLEMQKPIKTKFIMANKGEMAEATPEQLYEVAQRRQKRFADICAEELCQRLKQRCKI